MLDYWSEWPPSNELLRGFVGYKPLSKEERARREQSARQEANRVLGAPVAYEQLPKWLRDAHAKRKQIPPPKPPSGG